MKQLGQVQMDNIEDVTDSPEDWEDFWENEEEYLKTKSEYYFDYNRNDLNRLNPFKKQ